MPQKFGKILASWSVSEYEKHERSLAWYIAAGVLGFALFVWAIFTFNYLFALIIVLFSAIVYLRATSDPNIVKFLITTKGVRIGRREYQYKDIDRFWIIYDPPDVKKLYLAFKRSLAPRVMVPLKNQNPVKIREILLDFLFEDLEKEDEPMSEVIGRFAKL
ncbi:MAG: hypothetical protein UW39_C0033G0005 [Parcubacteria group bacterium GW2011_GWC2_44_17]|uniref:DUF5673 domain-containing protein n=1 Tax=Candidatus Jacksonbacteria bacterium RIFCSPLOWO2_02_FULL_44_20 TaxID=1798460 RepID=A0A1G2ABD9_9BACT|nr:MAG: hypothetical protein UW39_C0033G0005 [Parcubacteria group bacterium GW2011_GWC2_44_17]OGY70913.1 MAG: hypothetical protein A3E05_03625 [Candidatus Jacksonbacteria bacterium RIFCSPHIGHO2_12_FULL_44_12]OGY71289.1 MAG: hypothetical protein A3C00_03750 [Candidatus Jacksonbacteria bacterium RIFCSPHIGHO2_02_FULL_44_25]OGY73392.1 MAG: hypothetical protein A3H07_00535 [Candidatus Jacksonbacteria bacterium RIFCSPLOWO2_12_FULL_44_15b]OGY74132.1 MAG: hypothetical protein A3H61_04335 [Candidatus Ja